MLEERAYHECALANVKPVSGRDIARLEGCVRLHPPRPNGLLGRGIGDLGRGGRRRYRRDRRDREHAH